VLCLETLFELIGAFFLLFIISRINYLNKGNTKKIVLNCPKCGNELQSGQTVCQTCQVSVVSSPNLLQSEGQIVGYENVDKMYQMSEDNMLEEFIKRKLVKYEVDLKLIPLEVLKRRKIYNIIFLVLLFIYISMIFFHFPLLTYILGLIILIIFFVSTRKYNLIKYLKKQIQARPSENVSNIVMNMKMSLVKDNSKKYLLIGLFIAIILPLIIFMNPRIMYEKVDGGYAVRYYTFGLTNFSTAIIPEKYKGENVISLRGNTFSNMPFLKEVILPDTITEIRGQAFKNDISLVKVNIPKNLEYLGGGAFYNCISITNIELPDTLTYLGGEAFYNATSLENIKLSNNLIEIRGNTFENCSSLKEVTIPDKVTRIGGHAFYGCSSLSKVYITENSGLQVIGSSAFRLCRNLKNIMLPKSTAVDEKAFKESPTIISRYKKIEYDEVLNPYKYNYKEVVTLNISQKVSVNTNEQVEGNNITLVKISDNEFVLSYLDSKWYLQFVLTKDKPSKVINDNLALEIYDEDVFDYDDKIKIIIYYN